MSTSYRESTNAGKAARRGIVEQAEKPPPKKKVGVKSEMVTIEVLWDFALMRQGWQKWRSYQDMATAAQALSTLSRKSSYATFRIKE